MNHAKERLTTKCHRKSVPCSPHESRNTGTCIWNKFYAIAFSGGDDMSGATTVLRRAIPPNGAGNVSVELTAPDTPGTYTGYWGMTNSSGAPFGNVFYVQIVVQTDNASEDE